MKKFRKLLSIVLTASIVISMFSNAFTYAQNPSDTPASESDNNTAAQQHSAAPKFNISKSLRAVSLTAGVDFAANDGAADDHQAELEGIFDNALEFGMNSVYIKVTNENNSYYSTDMNNTGETDVISLAVDGAKNRGLQIYLVYDVNFVVANCPKGTNVNDYLISETHKFALKYPVNGILLDNYYTTKDAESFNSYMANGSGIGYNNWLYDNTEYRFKTVSDIIHLTDNTIAVGAVINDVWANSSSHEEGSETNDNFQAYIDGFADTKKFINKKYIDFASVHAYGSLTDGSLPFETVTNWWGDLLEESDIPMYIVHHNEKLGGTRLGWNSEDQMLRQLTISQEITSYNGSVFNSYDGLVENIMDTTTVLKKFFDEQINTQTLFEDLKMTSPSYTDYTTYDSTVPFMGTFDENFDVYFDGEKLSLNEAGNFYFEKALDVGSNTFSIRHKDKTITYTIERAINVMQSIDSSISEGKTLTVDGGTKISLTAVAYKGSTVTANINGNTITLNQSNSNSDGVDINSSYAKFTGTYTCPDGIEGQIQNLGTISVTAGYSGYSKTMMGANIIIKEIKKKVEQQIQQEIKDDQSSVGTGEIVGKISPSMSEKESATLVKLSKDFTYIYDGKNTSSVNRPDFGQLPAGTMDYYDSSWGSYFVTSSGKRFSDEDAILVDGNGFGDNKLLVERIGTSGGDAYLKIKLDDKITYKIETIGNSYFSGYDGDFYLDSFDATHVYITFDNVTAVTKLPSFENNAVFSSGKWEQVKIDGVPKFRLVLKLRQNGIYSGNAGYYDSDGYLMLKFNVLTSNIANMTIVVDPGHGVTDDGYDPGAVGHIAEADANLAVAKLLVDKLNKLGANAVRLETEKSYFKTMIRANYAREYDCDLFISLHSNKAGYEDARGSEAYYFTPFSQPLAESITNSVSSYFTNKVYSDGADKNRGALYSYFWVTKQQDFPSVLVEMGFVSNYSDAMALANKSHQDGIAQAIVNGIQNYIGRSELKYNMEGSSSGETDSTSADANPASEQTTRTDSSETVNTEVVSQSSS